MQFDGYRVSGPQGLRVASAASISPVAASLAFSREPAYTSANTIHALVNVWVSRPRAIWARHHSTVRTG